MKNANRKAPLLFVEYPLLKTKVPWILILTEIPTPINKLTELEERFSIKDPGGIYKGG